MSNAQGTASDSRQKAETQKQEGGDEQDSKNTGKRARVFDLSAMVAEARATAQSRTHEAEEKRKLEEVEKAIAAGGENSGEAEEAGTSVARGSARAGSSIDSAGNSVVATDDDDDDDFLPPLPPGFKPDQSVIVTDEKEAAKIKAAEGGGGEEEDDEYAGYTGEGLPTMALIPAACEAKLTHGSKAVTTIAFDHQGHRFVTGGQDYTINYFDFQKMDASLRPDRNVTPCESHVISSLAFSLNGEMLAVASGQAQIRILDRRGTQWAETVRGDQYLVDLSFTKGHTATINCIVWHPLIKSEFLTASDDGTLRLWSTDDFKEITKCINTHRKVIKTKTANGKRAQPQWCAYSPDGKLIVAGCDDGSIQAWKHAKMFVNTAYLVRNAHSAPLTCIVVSPDGKKLLTRGLDDTLKMWSLADKTKPLLVKDNLECGYRGTVCGFSPRGEMVYTGTSAPSSDVDGKLIFLNVDTFEPVYQILYPGVSCISIAWHARLNQIAVGLSDGSIRVYYDPAWSHGGIMGCIRKPIRRQRQNEVLSEGVVLSPLTLQMFQPRGDNPDEQEVTEWRLRRVLRIMDKQERPRFIKPADVPLTDKSFGGRVKQGGSTLHSYVAQQLGKEKNKHFLADNDVRASILRHAEEAEKNPEFINKAYKRTQPVPIFQKDGEEEEGGSDEELEPVYKLPRGQFST